MKKSVFGWAFIVAHLAVLSPALASITSRDYSAEPNEEIGFGERGAVPFGYYKLCMTNNPVCRVSRGTLALTKDDKVILTPSLSRILSHINREVNSIIKPRRDPRWRVSPTSGDCKDYALTKKARLLSLGWPSSALLLATAVTPRGESHAVLIVRTNKGDLILDNLAIAVAVWTPHLYRWKELQSPTDGLVWLQFAESPLHKPATLEPISKRPAETDVNKLTMTFDALSKIQILNSIWRSLAGATLDLHGSLFLE